MLRTYVINEWGVLLVTAIFFLLVAFLVYYRKRMEKHSQNPLSKKQSTALRIELDEVEAQELMLKLDFWIAQEKVYLDKDLSLGKLAKLLGTSNKKLSILLNEYLKSNFYDYLNKFRIAATKRLLRDPSCPLSIEGIARECGFKSRSSFYKVFKAYVGVTPSVYKKQH